MSDGMIAVPLGKFSNLSYFGGRRGGNIPLPNLTWRNVGCYDYSKERDVGMDKYRAYGISRESDDWLVEKEVTEDSYSTICFILAVFIVGLILQVNL